MSERIAWVDAYKGIAICYIVIGHSNCFLNPVVYLFHLNAFFFISGYTTSLTRESLPRFALQKAAAYLVPFIAINFLLVGLYLLADRAGVANTLFNRSYPPPGTDFLTTILVRLRPGVIELGGALWFLKTLFFTAILAKALQGLSARLRVPDPALPGVAFLLLFYGYFLFHRKTFTVYELELCLSSGFYFLCGDFARRHELFKRIDYRYCAPLSLGVIAAFSLLGYPGMDYNSRIFGNPFLDTAVSFAGILFTYSCAKAIVLNGHAQRIFIHIGKISLSIMAYHFVAFKLFFVLLFSFGLAPPGYLRNMVPPADNQHWPVLVMFTVAVVSAYDYLASLNRITSYLFLGRRAIRK